MSSGGEPYSNHGHGHQKKISFLQDAFSDQQMPDTVITGSRVEVSWRQHPMDRAWVSLEAGRADPGHPGLCASYDLWIREVT
jgi:hypothetical protein